MLDDWILTLNVIAFTLPLLGAGAIWPRSRPFAVAVLIFAICIYDLSWRLGGFPQWGRWIDALRAALKLP